MWFFFYLERRNICLLYSCKGKFKVRSCQCRAISDDLSEVRWLHLYQLNNPLVTLSWAALPYITYRYLGWQLARTRWLSITPLLHQLLSTALGAAAWVVTVLSNQLIALISAGLSPLTSQVTLRTFLLSNIRVESWIRLSVQGSPKWQFIVYLHAARLCYLRQISYCLLRTSYCIVLGW